MPQKFLNNFTSTFVSQVNATAATGTPATELGYGILQLNTGAAGQLTNPTGGDYYLLTAYKKLGNVESNIEIMRVTAVDNATPGECRVTVLRGQDGSTIRAYIAGDFVSLRLTRAGADNFLQKDGTAANQTAVAAATLAASSKATPVDGDALAMLDSAASNVLVRLSWANLKAGVFAAWGALTAAGTAKATPVGGDLLALSDSAASSATKSLTLTNLAAFLASLVQTLTNKTLTNATITNYTETVHSPAAGAAFTVDLANGTQQLLTTNANCTITLPAQVSGKSYTIWVKYGGTHTVTWAGGTTIKWAGGTQPTTTSVNGKKDKYVFECIDGETQGSDGGRNF